MTTLREEARRLSEKTMEEMYLSDCLTPEPVESALLDFAKLVLEREPSHAMETIFVTVGLENPDGGLDSFNAAYRAMTAELLRELQEKT